MSDALQRCIEMYDQRRAWRPQVGSPLGCPQGGRRDETESESRHVAIDWLARAAGIDYVPAAELLADALATRATKRQEN